MTYTEHIKQLCKDNGIHIEWTDKFIGEWPVAGALPKGPAVQIHEPTNDFLYMVALHEIGHVMTDTKSDRQLEREARAWDWAVENVKVDITPETWQKAFTALSSYVARMIKRDLKGQAAFVPSNDHWFWSVYVLLAQFAFPVVDIVPRQARENIYGVLAARV